MTECISCGKTVSSCCGVCVRITIPSKYSIYLVWNNILSIFLEFQEYSIYHFFFWLFHFFKISPDPCPKWPKNDFKRDEKRVKHRVLNIFQLFFFENPFWTCPIFYLFQDYYICICIYVCISAYIHMDMYLSTYTVYIHTYIHIYTHIHIHLNIYIYIYI